MTVNSGRRFVLTMGFVVSPPTRRRDPAVETQTRRRIPVHPMPRSPGFFPERHRRTLPNVRDRIIGAEQCEWRDSTTTDFLCNRRTAAAVLLGHLGATRFGVRRPREMVRCFG
jgi:hypothetical protein